MTFGEACRELRRRGFSNLWSLELWTSFSGKEPPQTMTDEYIRRNEYRSADWADWDVNGRKLILIRSSDGTRFQIYEAA